MIQFLVKCFQMAEIFIKKHRDLFEKVLGLPANHESVIVVNKLNNNESFM
jgi:hypothetical protein